MKRNIIKVSVFAILIGLLILGIKNLISVKVNNTGINYTEKQAYTVPDVAKDYNVPREAWYTNQLNRFFIPYAGRYQIYCTNRDKSFPLEESYYKSATDGKIYYGQVNKLNSGSNITYTPTKAGYLSADEAYVFSRDSCTSWYKYSTDYKSDAYNTVSATVKNWYIKQNAYWLLNNEECGSYVDRSIIVNDNGKTTKWNTGTTIKSEIYKLVNEATNYYTYHEKVKDNGLNPTWISTNVKKEYKNGEVILGPYKMSYYSLGTNGYRFSGVSDMEVITYANGQQFGSAKVKSIKMKGKNKSPKYFEPGDDYISRQNDIWYPDSGEEFYVIISGTSDIDKIDFQLDVTFKYMIASGYEVRCKGKYGSNNDVQPVTVVDAKREIKSEKIKKITDTTLTGKYKVYIRKIDFSKDENPIGNVKFNISGKVNKTVKTNTNGKAYVNSVTITKSTLGNDVYYITENSAKSGYIKFDEKIKLTVTKSEKNGKFSASAKVVVLDENDKEASESRKSIAKVEIANDEITVTIKNTKIEDGSFNLNIKKVSAGTSEEPKSGAYFNIKKWVEINTTTHEWDWEKNGKTIKTEKEGEKGVYNLLRNVTIDKATTLYYWITETQAPTNYAKFTGGIKVVVTTGVKQNGNKAKYVVKSVSIIAFDKNNKKLDPSPVTNEGTGNETTINLKMTNIQKGSYDLKLNKVSSTNSSDPLSGAVFKIEKKENGNWKQIKLTTTNSNGECTLLNNEKITNLNDDEYKITETTAPYGFVKFDGSIEVKVPKKIDMTEGKYVIDNITLTVKDKNGNKITKNSPVSKNQKDGTITLTMKNEPQYDLALRKFITSINGIAPKESREPKVDLTTLKDGTFDRNNNKEYTATYKHNKDEEGKVLKAATGDKVVYTIRIYNEGKKAGTATEITDYLPAGLKLADNSTINKKYGWKKGDSDKEYTAYTTTYLKDQNEIIPAFDEKNNKLSYKDVQIECEVIATKAKDNLKNIAEITADDGDDRDSTPKNVNRGNYGSTSQEDDDDFEVLKFRPTLNLGGTVWEDLRGGKETLADGLKDSGESGIGGIKVELYQKNDANPETDGTKILETTTNSNGTYTFEKLPTDKWYYVKFTYNGQNYENTMYKATRENDDKRKNSVAAEKKQDRDNFNEGFNINEISNTEKKEKTEEYFGDYNKLTYKNKANTDTNCAISAYTGHQVEDNFNYSFYAAISSPDNVTINTIDFGITKRIEFDMALKQDVYAATVTVNGKTQIYGYDKKNIQDSIPNFDKLPEDEKEKALNNWTITVVEGDYQRAIAEPDYNFTGVSGNDKTLEVYVTYKVAIRNQSMSMLGEVTKIKDYYDQNYTYVSELSWISSKNYNANDLKNVRGRIVDSLEKAQEISKEKNESKVSINSDTNNTLDIKLSEQLQSGETKYLYLTFKVNTDDEEKVITGTKTNTAEIAAFKSYYKKGTVLPHYNGENEYEVKDDTTIAGRVDRDSIPNNLNKSKGPQEDDEDKAPGLHVKVEGNRTITGTVWEDARNNKVDDSVIGNGTYENGTDTEIDIEKEKINVELYRAKSEKQFELVDASPSIKGSRYTFNNVVAGDYIVRFTYGDGTVKYNGQDYKTTIYQDYGDSDKYNLDVSDENLSRAADLWDVRTTLNASSAANVKNEMAEKLAKGEGSKMIADTKTIVAEIEYNRQVTTENPAPGYAIKGVNLGLVERPKAQLELNKTVSNVKVTLADGSILFDASQGVNVDNVAWQQNTNKNRGLIQLSMDQEIMHGASIQITYKLTVKNVGEVDYEGKEFYYTGKNHGNTVTTTPNTVVDYVSNNLQFNGKNNPGWEVVKLDKLYKEENSPDNYIDQAVKTKAQKINTIVKTNALNTALEPGKSVDTTLVLTQVITPENKNDNLTYSNIAEIVEVSNTVGRKMAFSIVGNQDPTANTPSEIDASIAERIVILPPFGDGNIVYYILGAVVGIILIGGITLIIKKVLIIK